MGLKLRKCEFLYEFLLKSGKKNLESVTAVKETWSLHQPNKEACQPSLLYSFRVMSKWTESSPGTEPLFSLEEGNFCSNKLLGKKTAWHLKH